MDDNTRILIDELKSAEYQLGKINTQVNMLIDILFINAEKTGKHERRYGYNLEDVSVDGKTILAIFRQEYPQKILDLFKDEEEEEEKEEE